MQIFALISKKSLVANHGFRIQVLAQIPDFRFSVTAMKLRLNLSYLRLKSEKITIIKVVGDRSQTDL